MKKLIATLLQTTNQQVSVTEINSFRNESLVVFPTPKVVANMGSGGSPGRQEFWCILDSSSEPSYSPAMQNRVCIDPLYRRTIWCMYVPHIIRLRKYIQFRIQVKDFK